MRADIHNPEASLSTVALGEACRTSGYKTRTACGTLVPARFFLAGGRTAGKIIPHTIRTRSCLTLALTLTPYLSVSGRGSETFGEPGTSLDGIAANANSNRPCILGSLGSQFWLSDLSKSKVRSDTSFDCNPDHPSPPYSCCVDQRCHLRIQQYLCCRAALAISPNLLRELSPDVTSSSALATILRVDLRKAAFSMRIIDSYMNLGFLAPPATWISWLSPLVA